MTDTQKTVLLVDCLQTSRTILVAALNHAGFTAECCDLSDFPDKVNDYHYIVFYLNHQNQPKIVPCLTSYTLKTRRILIIVDPKETCLLAPIHPTGSFGVLFRPVQMRALIAKLNELPNPQMLLTGAPIQKLMSFDREFVEKRLEESKPRLITADTQIQPDEFLSEEFLTNEENHDREIDREMFDFTIDESEIEDSWFDSSENLNSVFREEKIIHPQPDSEDDDEDYDEEDIEDDDEDDDEEKRRLAWGIEQYGEELPPDVWKAQVLERLERERKLKAAKTNQKLLIAIAILMVIIFIALLKKYG